MPMNGFQATSEASVSVDPEVRAVKLVNDPPNLVIVATVKSPISPMLIDESNMLHTMTS